MEHHFFDDFQPPIEMYPYPCWLLPFGVTLLNSFHLSDRFHSHKDRFNFSPNPYLCIREESLTSQPDLDLSSLHLLLLIWSQTPYSSPYLRSLCFYLQSCSMLDFWP
jgi:hypothetical protein